MKYLVKIQLGEKESLEKYYKWEDLYEQIIDDLDLSAVIAVVNKLKKGE